MRSMEEKQAESWEQISRLFEKSTEAEQDLYKSIFNYAYRNGYNSGYAAGLTDEIINKVGGEDN